MLGDEGDGVEAAVDRGHASYLDAVRRRGGAAPPPWSPCPEPWRRGCSPRRDCCRRPVRARDSGRAPRARRPPATAAWSRFRCRRISPRRAREKSAGRTFVAVTVADDLVGEIEFGGIELAVFLAHAPRRHRRRRRHVARGPAPAAPRHCAARDRRPESGGRRRRSRRAGRAGSSASTASGTPRCWRSRARTLPACRPARARCRSRSSIRRRTPGSRSGGRDRRACRDRRGVATAPCGFDGEAM